MIESTTVALGLRQIRSESCFAYLIDDPDSLDTALVDPRADRVTTTCASSRSGDGACVT